MAGRQIVSFAALAAIIGGTTGYILSDTQQGHHSPLSAYAAEVTTMPKPALSPKHHLVKEIASVASTAQVIEGSQKNLDNSSRQDTVVLEKGSNLMAVLTGAGLERSVAFEAIEALRDVYNPRKLRAGQEFDLVYASEISGDTGDLLDTLRFQPDAETIVSVSRTDDGFSASTDKVELVNSPNATSGTIDQSLFMAAEKNGMPLSVLMEMIKLYSYDVDFQRDIQPGDSFEVMYDDMKNTKGDLVRHGDIVYASMNIRGTDYRLYSYTDSDGNQDFYNEKGESFRRALMRTPINGSRLSSGFGMRKHPILGYSRMHQGVDFAAPTGTPIFAAGNGTIERIGKAGGYGNYIRLRHNSTYETAYGHMSRFAKGLHTGSRVKQGDVIGYVGMSGTATGPHLHFEILKAAHQVNPISVKMPSGRTLTGKELDRFRNNSELLQKQYAELSIEGAKVASAD
ncbi:M23 family metallopeptidase [Thalassospira mesophila]|uniref:M23 family metallopeptidase n=1 Tax=Thalassospira mesophila TaxID=1293891 RepID=UPI001FE56061|nr:peptidoglycan DD-metalloendopeptidase family protein [Thalassospira mesophila]